MALIFDRKAFKSGVQLVREPQTVDGVEGIKTYTFVPKDKKKSFEFIDEDYVLEKYDHLFTKA